ncbi:MAG: hypothetical protein LBK05_08810 [Treponema sp.]|jgi:hypothetical protein|nr:hypothetical protein [Treponema sp.]
MEFYSFKDKLKTAGFKVGLLSKTSYMELCKMIPADENILFSSESYPEKASGNVGAVVITDKKFYGQIPLADKTFQSIIIDRSEIIGLVFPEGKNTNLKLQTSQGIFDIGQVLNNFQRLVSLINKKETVVVSNSSSQEESSLNYHQKEAQDDIDTLQNSYNETKNEKKLRCPKCGSENIEPMPVTKGKTKGFGLGKAAVGGLALGPIGLAAGVIGMGKGKTQTDIVWICKACANQFAKPKKE